MTTTGNLHDAVERLDWDRLEESLDSVGHAVTPALLSPRQCRALAALWDRDALFRSTIDLARYRFGEGSYRYFAEPVPEPVASLREAFYAPLATIANRWQARLGSAERFPRSFAAWRRRCHVAGQRRPTPLLLDYGAGGYNCLHQDLYGELAFPLQLTAMLTRPGEDFSGGEFLLVEQRPRMQSRGEAVALARGCFVVFPNRLRPVQGKRGSYRVQVRHGVSRVRAGHRRTLGIIFHDAR